MAAATVLGALLVMSACGGPPPQYWLVRTHPPVPAEQLSGDTIVLCHNEDCTLGTFDAITLHGAFYDTQLFDGGPSMNGAFEASCEVSAIAGRTQIDVYPWFLFDPVPLKDGDVYRELIVDRYGVVIFDASRRATYDHSGRSGVPNLHLDLGPG